MALRTVEVFMVVVIALLPVCVVGGRSHLAKAGMEVSMGELSVTSGSEISERHVSLLPHRRLLQKPKKNRKVDKGKTVEDSEQEDEVHNAAEGKSRELEDGVPPLVGKTVLREDLTLVDAAGNNNLNKNCNFQVNGGVAIVSLGTPTLSCPESEEEEKG